MLRGLTVLLLGLWKLWSGGAKCSGGGRGVTTCTRSETLPHTAGWQFGNQYRGECKCPVYTYLGGPHTVMAQLVRVGGRTRQLYSKKCRRLRVGVVTPSTTQIMIIHSPGWRPGKKESQHPTTPFEVHIRKHSHSDSEAKMPFSETLYSDISRPSHTAWITYCQQPYLRYLRYPGISRLASFTIPARPGIFNSRTHDTHAYPGIEQSGNVPGICRCGHSPRGCCGRGRLREQPVFKF